MRPTPLSVWLVGIAAVTGCGAGPSGPAQVCSAAVARGCWESLGLDGHHVTAVTATPMGIFAGDFSEGVFRLDSAVGSWVSLGVDHAIVSSLLYVPGDTARLLVGVWPQDREETAAAVFATEDGGETWKPWDGGLADQSNDQRFWAFSLAVDLGNPRRLFMGSSAAILRSPDGGGTWEFAFGGPTSSALGVLGIAISPRRDGNLWAGGESPFFTGYVRHSSDWGDSWQHVEVNVAAITVLAIDPDAPEVLWAGAPGGIMSSLDNGETWEVRLRGLIVGGIVFIDSGAYVFGTELPEVRIDGHLMAFQSLDRGEHWEPLPVPADVQGAIAVSVDQLGRVLVGTSGSGVWRYTPE